MSEAEEQQSSESTEKDEGGFSLDSFDDILELVNEKLSSLQGQFESEEKRADFEQGNYEGPVMLASDPSVISEALKSIGNVRQHHKAMEHDIEEEEKRKKIGVDLDVPDDTQTLLKEFDNILAEVRQPIVEEIERRQSGAEKNPMVDDNEPIMTYIFEKNAGAYGDVTILGGAKAVVFNLSEQYGYTEDERQLIRKCHEIAADRNGVERHTLIEDIAIAPQFKHEDIDIVE